jgi:hypothetical protein
MFLTRVDAAVPGFKSPGSKTGKFCVGVKSPLQNLITNYELRITNYELRITNYELRITNYELRII